MTDIEYGLKNISDGTWVKNLHYGNEKTCNFIRLQYRHL